LLHPAQVVPIDPGFGGLPVSDTSDGVRCCGEIPPFIGFDDGRTSPPPFEGFGLGSTTPADDKPDKKEHDCNNAQNVKDEQAWTISEFHGVTYQNNDSEYYNDARKNSNKHHSSSLTSDLLTQAFHYHIPLQITSCDALHPFGGFMNQKTKVRVN
jgi:hypothetical protein